MSFIDKLEVRVNRTINWLEKNLNNFHDGKLTMDKIAIACALDYTMFRFTNIWQKENLNLYNWLEKFNKNSFMKLTQPKVTV